MQFSNFLNLIFKGDTSVFCIYRNIFQVMQKDTEFCPGSLWLGIQYRQPLATFSFLILNSIQKNHRILKYLNERPLRDHLSPTSTFYTVEKKAGKVSALRPPSSTLILILYSIFCLPNCILSENTDPLLKLLLYLICYTDLCVGDIQKERGHGCFK